MCRHVAYLGPPIPLAELLFTPPHSLSRQSWAPLDMRGGGTINADGFGIGWFEDPKSEEPIRYRRESPLWSDAGLPALAAAARSGAILAAVRSATVGMPVTESAAAPFTAGRWLFSHNGVIAGWPDSVAGVARGLPVRDLLTLEAPTDSALLWTLVRAHLRAGDPPATALSAVVARVSAAAPGSRLNLLLTDGETIAATACGHSLSYLARDTSTVDASVLVASEPLFGHHGWIPVPDRALLVANPASATITAMEGVAP
ncbi:ergothioneine biosynthesis protein EgtC [Dactylosporangium sp. NPDC048998]|uniref:ergothioneine biosynthesis protein EgtC n=1 Tax=Dactylosporangium sp. NPDC048998 TaxID=3363976 RepID=UPI0037139096